MNWRNAVRKVRNIFFGVLAFFLILLATISALVETETGSRWTVTRITSLVGMEVRGISGNLRTGLDIQFLEYRTDTQSYSAEQLSFRWRPVGLLYSALVVDSLRAQSVTIQPPVSTDPEPAQPFNQWPHLRLPVRIHLQQLQLNNIELVQGESRMHWNQLSGSSLSWGTFNFRYNNVALVHDDYMLHLTGVSELAFPYATKAGLQWQWQPAEPENTAPVTAIVTTTPAVPASSTASVSSASSASSTPAPAIVPVVDPVETVLAYMGVSEINGDLKSLQVSTAMSSPVVLSAVINTSLLDENNYLLTAPLFQLAANWQQQTLPAQWWVPGQPVPVTSGEINANGNWQQYAAELQGDISLPAAPALRGLSGNMFGISASVNGDLEKVHIDFLRLRERYISTVVDAANNNSGAASSVSSNQSSQASPTTAQITETNTGLNIEGDVRWLPHIDWQLQVQAEHLNLVSLFEHWPSDINANFSTSGSNTNSAWNIHMRDLKLDGNVRGLNIQGDGSLSYDGKNIHSDALHLIFGANQVRLKGDIGEAFNLDWDINAPMLDQIDGSLHGSVVSKGQLRGNRQKPRLDINTRIEHFSWGDYAVNSLELSLAPKETIMGPANEQAATAPDQSANSSTEPAATVSASVAENLMTAIRTEDYSLAFTANQLRVPGNQFSTLGITGNGSIGQHRLQALIRHTDLGRADFTLRGGYDAAQWQGQFEHLAIKLKKVPRWWLTSSKSLRVKNGAVMMDRQCFTTRSNLTGQVERISAVDQEKVIGEWMPNQSYAKNNYNWLVKDNALPSSPIETYSLPQLCIDGEWASTTGAQLHANIDSIPLRQFLSLFKVEVYFAGVMDGSLRVNSPDFSLANTKASARVSTRNAELRYQYSGGTTEVYPWREFAVKADLEKGKLIAAGDMEWTGYGRINANTDLDLQQQKINSGQFIARFSNLAPLETVLPYANDVKGDFLADLSFGGNFSQPYLLGNVSLHNGTANLPRLGIDLTNIELQVNSSQAGTINLVTQLQSNKGRLSLVGDLNRFGMPDWNVQGFLNGSDVQVINLPQMKATVTPDIKIIANSSSLDVSGDLLIPWARFNIKNLPESATKVSPDAVIVDEQSAQAEVEEKMKILTNLNLSLGNDVSFQGFGLNSKLTGKVNLLKETQRQFFTSGYVSVTEGNYKAYGQELTIDRGRLLFQGPYENPGIEIIASRTIRDDENTRVGLEITGTLQRPKATMLPTKFSDSEAMMMLLTGKPLGEASKADASMLVSAMSGLGGDSGGSLTSGITRFFGVDQLEVKSEDGLEQSELWVGKYLTPRLLVRYVVGIFDQAFRLGMEYQLTERLRIEAESGETQSVDMVYKIER